MEKNNSCERCQKIHYLEAVPKKLLFIFPVVVLREKMKEILNRVGHEYSQINELLEVRTSDLRGFIEALLTKGEFSQPELNDILCLALDEDEDFSFTSYSKIKPLSKWFSILESEDYLKVIKSENLIVHFHPIIDAKTLKIFGYECLIRGVSANGQLIPPLVLFELAEKTDTLFYLDRACREIAVKSAAERNLRDYKIFINFIPTSIYDPQSCLQTTIQAAISHNFDPSNLVFEVVESQKVRDINHLSNIISYYRNHGFMVALDDMGTGYANIEMLINLKPDLVKIDRQIISNIHNDSVKQRVFKGVVKVCEETEILKIAEGVERKEEFEYVREYVDLVQGFLFSKPDKEPLREEELADRIRELT